MLEIFKGASGIIKVVVPIAIFVFGILMAWGMIKWSARLGAALKGLASNPGYIIMAVIVIALLLYVWFAYVAPMMP